MANKGVQGLYALVAKRAVAMVKRAQLQVGVATGHRKAFRSDGFVHLYICLSLILFKYLDDVFVVEPVAEACALGGVLGAFAP